MNSPCPRCFHSHCQRCVQSTCGPCIIDMTPMRLEKLRQVDLNLLITFVAMLGHTLISPGLDQFRREASRICKDHFVVAGHLNEPEEAKPARHARMPSHSAPCGKALSSVPFR